jgi:hypothetical protein
LNVVQIKKLLKFGKVQILKSSEKQTRQKGKPEDKELQTETSDTLANTGKKNHEETKNGEASGTVKIAFFFFQGSMVEIARMHRSCTRSINRISTYCGRSFSPLQPAQPYLFVPLNTHPPFLSHLDAMEART